MINQSYLYRWKNDGGEGESQGAAEDENFDEASEEIQWISDTLKYKHSK